MAPQLVTELRQLALSGSTDVAELVRRAKVVASKLGLSDFDDWLEHELNGYPAEAQVPDYRVVGCQLMSRLPPYPAQPVGFFGEVQEGAIDLAKHFSSLPMRQPVAQVAYLVGRSAKENGSGYMKCSLGEGEMKALVEGNRDLLDVEVFRVVSESGVAAILDVVRNRILNWSIDLERRGILGADMSFTKAEQASATSQITINNYGSVGSVVQGPNATATTAQSSPGSVMKVATGSAAISERLKIAIEATRILDAGAATAIERLADGVAKTAQLAEEAKTEATEALAAVAEQCAVSEERRLPRSVLTSVVVKLRETLSLSADVLQVWTTFGPSLIAWLDVVLK